MFKFSLVVNIIVAILILALVGLLVYSNFVTGAPNRCDSAAGKGGSDCEATTPPPTSTGVLQYSTV